MKRIFLACVVQCCSFSALALVDLQYHGEQPSDNKISESYQQKRSVLKHKIWSAEAVAQANDEAIAQEQARAIAEHASRQQHNTHYGEYRCGKNKQQHSKRCYLPGGGMTFPGFKGYR
ncbi:hypothetical protein [Serratia grimesii]|uniref:hypothetical protein n=1 Tax=Serratia grimesii TaxID=82995 RepID=UPI002240B19C|nr:hypothetical protein [Serratia grimesii]